VWPDVGALGSFLLLWFLLMLMVPKRNWQEIPSRLGAVLRGGRHHVYGPPPSSERSDSALPPAFIGVAGEVVRLFEMGLALFLIAIWAEGRSARRRLEARRIWDGSAAALLSSRIDGALNGEQLRSMLAQGGHPLLARKEVEAAPRQYVVPPMQWRLDWEQRRLAAIPGPSDDPWAEDAPGETVGGPELTSIQSLGRLHLWAGDTDLAAELLARPRAAFTWLYLLAREVLGPRAYVTSDAFADEGAPGLDLAAQRKALNNRVNHLRHDEPVRPLGARVVRDGPYIHLNLEGCPCDAIELLRAVDEVRDAGPMLSPSMGLRIEKLLESQGGEFLQEWDELERDTTQGRGTAADLIRDVRRKIEDARAYLLVALGESYLSRREPVRAVRYFEEALDRQPENEETARKLVGACSQTGQGGYAKQVRLRYGLRDEEASSERPSAR
jgi:hypothetical protein